MKIEPFVQRTTENVIRKCQFPVESLDCFFFSPEDGKILNSANKIALCSFGASSIGLFRSIIYLGSALIAQSQPIESEKKPHIHEHIPKIHGEQF